MEWCCFVCRTPNLTKFIRYMSRQYLFSLLGDGWHCGRMDGIVEGWMDGWNFGRMDGIVEGWMEFSSGSVWRVAVVQSGEDLANLIRTHWHDHPDHHRHHHCYHHQCDHQQVAGKTMDNFSKMISIQVRTCFCEESQLFWRSFTNICVEPISGRQRGKGNFQLNDFGNCCRVPAEEENGCYLSEYN